MTRPEFFAALAVALATSCANHAAPPMHHAQAIGLRLPTPLVALDGEGSVTSFPLGNFAYDLEMEPSGFGLEWETSISEEGEWTWLSGLTFMQYDLEAQGRPFEGDALMISTGPRYWFSIDSEWQPFVSAALAYSPELDLDGNDYGSFATLSLGGGVAWFPSMDFSIQVGVDWVETIVEPDYNSLTFDPVNFVLVSVKDEVSFNGLNFWIGGSWWF